MTNVSNRSADGNGSPHDYRRSLINGWTNQSRIKVRGLHHPQEDSPHEIGQGLAEWYAGI